MENALDTIQEAASAAAAETEANVTDTAQARLPGEPAGETAVLRKTPEFEIMNLVDEAERRGYRRGWQAARKSGTEGCTELWAPPEDIEDEPLDTGAGILRCMRPGVWDD